MANVEPIDNTQQPISDDQELAKVLAGVDQQAEAAVEVGTGTLVPPTADDDDDTVVSSLPDPATIPTPEPVVTPVSTPLTQVSGDLSAVKQEALTELRPLVDKLDVSPEEKFDTYLLLLRSTDDKALIAPAHEAAKNIADEARRAQALLDIIKEIDFLSGPQQ